MASVPLDEPLSRPLTSQKPFADTTTDMSSSSSVSRTKASTSTTTQSDTSDPTSLVASLSNLYVDEALLSDASSPHRKSSFSPVALETKQLPTNDSSSSTRSSVENKPCSLGLYGVADRFNAPLPTDTSARRNGSVKFFSATKGFGFILDSNMAELDGEEVFVHYTAIESVRGGPTAFKALAEGEFVEYFISKGEKGWTGSKVTGPNGGPCKGISPAGGKSDPNKAHRRQAQRAGAPLVPQYLYAQPALHPYGMSAPTMIPFQSQLGYYGQPTMAYYGAGQPLLQAVDQTGASLGPTHSFELSGVNVNHLLVTHNQQSSTNPMPWAAFSQQHQQQTPNGLSYAGPPPQNAFPQPVDRSQPPSSSTAAAYAQFAYARPPPFDGRGPLKPWDSPSDPHFALPDPVDDAMSAGFYGVGGGQNEDVKR